MDFYVENGANCSYAPIPYSNPASLSTPQLLSFISDDHLSLIAGPLAYIITSTFFHIADILNLFPQYKIHPSPEDYKRNRVTRLACLWSVIRYHMLAMGIGYGLMKYAGETTPPAPVDVAIAQWAGTVRYAGSFVPWVLSLFALDSSKLSRRLSINGAAYSILSGKPGCPAGPNTVLPWEYAMGWSMYHVIAPAYRLLLNLFVVDTWIYFGHRACHVNRFLYRLVHAQHHELYVPYAYGAAYASVWESIFLDTLSYMFANWVSGVTTREAMLFAVLATMKTNHDHCGYLFPCDPFVLINPNGPRFHDWHHQMPGFRYNFSSYLVIWDNWLGTRATPKDRGKALANGSVRISVNPFEAFDISKQKRVE